VYIIDEVHMLSTAAFNALLKTLEEPPAHVKFILATTEEHKVPMTIKSRCQQFNFRLLTSKEINGRLQWLAEKEGLTVEPAALDLIAQQGAGSLRDAESLMDQLITSPDDPITLERTQMVLGTATEQSIALVTGAWLTGNSGDGLRVIHDALSSGADARQFARQMVAYLRELLLLKAAGDALPLDGTAERKQAMLAQVNRTSTSALIRAVKAFNEAAMATTSSWQPQLPLELAYISLMGEVAAVPMETVVTQTAVSPAPVATPPMVTTTPVAPTQAAPVKTSPSPPPMQKRVDVQQNPPPPPPETEPEPVVETAPSPTNSQPITLDAVRGNWREMVSQVGVHIKSLPALLNMGKPLALEGNVIIIGFDYPIFKDKFDKEVKAAPLINQTYSTLLNSTCTVRGVVTSEYAVPVQEEEVRKLAKELGGVVKIKN
jgi:DNA polymerase-3 subunit gamma/tau